MLVAVEVATVLFLATVIRSAFGFGEALVAVPLLALALPVKTAAPLAVLASITVAIVVVARDWRHIHLRSAVWLVLPTFFGIPLGLLVLKRVPEPVVKACLAAVIIGFSAWSLRAQAATRAAVVSGKAKVTPRPRFELRTEKLAGVFGFAAGILGGAYGMNGPPLAMYGSLRRWPPANFRATLQGYFLPASVAGMAGYWLSGLWTPTVNRFYLISLPGVVAGIYLGREINRRMHPQRFVLFVHAGLIAIGVILLAQAL